MAHKYLVKIFTKYLQTEFKTESETEINDVEGLHKPIIDFLGKNDIIWEKNDFQYHSTGSSFYITYEEVNDGSGQYGTVRKETETRI